MKNYLIKYYQIIKLIFIKYILILFFLFVIALIISCHKSSPISSAANANSVENNAPMGSKVNNDLMQKELKVLNKLFNGYFSIIEINNAKMYPYILKKNFKNEIQANILKNLYKKLSLNNFVFPLKNSIKKDFLIGKLYFANQRFIESAIKLSLVLDENNVFPWARNMLAKSFYFLGNSNRALKELDFILLNYNKNLSESIDALYWTGIIIKNSKTILISKLKKGIFALETYLKIVKNTLNISDIKFDLEILKSRLILIQKK